MNNQLFTQFVTESIEIKNQKGLHSRAAAKFVKVANAFKAETFVQKDDLIVSAHSIIDLLMLTAGKGTKLVLKSSGSEAREALKALKNLVLEKFQED
ncbi:MAG: HPr family phosphocarrier protein [Proteobacteria bacterium]|nr:HPr family phosphocarrier protein [Pseudomonadota bacterium]